ETTWGGVPAAGRQGRRCVSERCSPEWGGAPDLRGFVPRVWAVYEVFGDGKTAVKVSASRYDQPITLSNVQRVNPLGIVNDTRAWTVCAAGQRVGCDLNGDLTPQLNELGVSSGFAFGTNNRYADGLEWPVSNEYNLELQRQLPGSIVLSAGYTRRETRRNIGVRNVAVPLETYIPLQVTEANSGRQVTVYNQAPALRGKTDYLWDNV